MLITKNVNGTCSFEIYRKSTNTNRVLNYNSYAPISYKRSVVSGLVHKAKTICSSDKINQEIINVKNILKMNNYPPKFTERIIKEALIR